MPDTLSKITIFMAGAMCFAMPSAMTAQETSASSIQISQNFAEIVPIAKPAGTIIVGDDTVLSAILNDANTLVLTGQKVGTTNLIVLSSDGQKVLESIVKVIPRREPVMKVHQGARIETYNCASRCERLNDGSSAMGQPNQQE